MINFIFNFSQNLSPPPPPKFQNIPPLPISNIKVAFPAAILDNLPSARMFEGWGDEIWCVRISRQEGGNPHLETVLATAVAAPQRASHRSRSDLVMNRVLDKFLWKFCLLIKIKILVVKNIYFDALVYP